LVDALEHNFSYLDEAVAAARAAPLSSRKALTAIMLVDAMADRLFEARGGAEDVLAFRKRLAEGNDALRLVFAVASQKLRLAIEPVEVGAETHPSLPVEEFMVSLYDGRRVQRVVVIDGDARHDAHEVIAEAVRGLRTL
jgi:hypothetical protein